MSLAISEKLKGLRAQITKSKANLSRMDADRKNINDAIRREAEKLKQLEKDLTSAANKKPSVSDHAVLRWMERLMGFDIEAIRTQILSEGRAIAVENIGKGKVPVVGESAHLVVEGNTVVTVVGGHD